MLLSESVEPPNTPLSKLPRSEASASMADDVVFELDELLLLVLPAVVPQLVASIIEPAKTANEIYDFFIAIMMFIYALVELVDGVTG